MSRRRLSRKALSCMILVFAIPIYEMEQGHELRVSGAA